VALLPGFLMATPPRHGGSLDGRRLAAGTPLTGVTSKLFNSEEMPLSAAAEGVRLRVERLPAESFLRGRLLAMGIRPGAQLEVLRRGRPGGLLHVACGILEFMIRQEHAAQLEVSISA
jgi:ferrous iron transport protein A